MAHTGPDSPPPPPTPERRPPALETMKGKKDIGIRDVTNALLNTEANTPFSFTRDELIGFIDATAASRDAIKPRGILGKLTGSTNPDAADPMLKDASQIVARARMRAGGGALPDYAGSMANRYNSQTGRRSDGAPTVHTVASRAERYLENAQRVAEGTGSPNHEKRRVDTFTFTAAELEDFVNRVDVLESQNYVPGEKADPHWEQMHRDANIFARRGHERGHGREERDITRFDRGILALRHNSTKITSAQARETLSQIAETATKPAPEKKPPPDDTTEPPPSLEPLVEEKKRTGKKKGDTEEKKPDGTPKVVEEVVVEIRTEIANIKKAVQKVSEDIPVDDAEIVLENVYMRAQSLRERLKSLPEDERPAVWKQIQQELQTVMQEAVYQEDVNRQELETQEAPAVPQEDPVETMTNALVDNKDKIRDLLQANGIDATDQNVDTINQILQSYKGDKEDTLKSKVMRRGLVAVFGTFMIMTMLGQLTQEGENTVSSH